MKMTHIKTLSFLTVSCLLFWGCSDSSNESVTAPEVDNSATKDELASVQEKAAGEIANLKQKAEEEAERNRRRAPGRDRVAEEDVAHECGQHDLGLLEGDPHREGALPEEADGADGLEVILMVYSVWKMQFLVLVLVSRKCSIWFLVLVSSLS